MSAVYPPDVTVRREAVISQDGQYRYSLVRRWGVGGFPAQFIMLNPSTADDALDDPTIRRCVGFARSLGASGLVVVNLYAFRATKPVDLWRADDPVGPDADTYLGIVARRAATEGAPLIAAWGASARPDRVEHVRALVAERGANLTALGVTKDGAPRHPLYLPATAVPTPWSPRDRPER